VRQWQSGAWPLAGTPGHVFYSEALASMVVPRRCALAEIPHRALVQQAESPPGSKGRSHVVALTPASMITSASARA
jgi:hypothetical protein